MLTVSADNGESDSINDSQPSDNLINSTDESHEVVDQVVDQNHNLVTNSNSNTNNNNNNNSNHISSNDNHLDNNNTISVINDQNDTIDNRITDNTTADETTVITECDNTSNGMHIFFEYLKNILLPYESSHLTFSPIIRVL